MSPVIADEMTVNPEQNKLWRTGQSKYSAKPKSMWELGLHGGSAFIAGDVEAPFPAGYGFGLHLRKAINYTLSWRLDATYQTSKGYDARSFNYLDQKEPINKILMNSLSWSDIRMRTTNEDNIHRNYETNILAFYC